MVRRSRMARPLQWGIIAPPFSANEMFRSVLPKLLVGLVRLIVNKEIEARITDVGELEIPHECGGEEVRDAMTLNIADPRRAR